MSIPACPSDVARMGESGDGRVSELLATSCDVLGPRRAVPIAKFVATGRVFVPRRRNTRCARCAGSGRRRGGGIAGIARQHRRSRCRCGTLRHGTAQEHTETSIGRAGDRDDFPTFRRLTCEFGSQAFGACIERIKCRVFEHEWQAIAGS